jgi:hypothetical protein
MLGRNSRGLRPGKTQSHKRRDWTIVAAILGAASPIIVAIINKL